MLDDCESEGLEEGWSENEIFENKLGVLIGDLAKEMDAGSLKNMLHAMGASEEKANDLYYKYFDSSY